MDDVAILKYLLLLLSAPIWLPVVKALWVEVNRMLVDDGGVFGRPPTEKEAEVLRKEHEGLPPALVHEPLAVERRKQASARSPLPRPKAGPPPPPRRPGFR